MKYILLHILEFSEAEEVILERIDFVLHYMNYHWRWNISLTPTLARQDHHQYMLVFFMEKPHFILSSVGVCF